MTIARFKVLLGIILGVIGFVDIVVATRFYLNGYPKYAVMTNDRIKVYPIPFTGFEWGSPLRDRLLPNWPVHSVAESVRSINQELADHA